MNLGKDFTKLALLPTQTGWGWMVKEEDERSGCTINKGVEIVRPAPSLVFHKCTCTDSPCNNYNASECLGKSHRPRLKLVGRDLLGSRHSHNLNKTALIGKTSSKISELTQPTFASPVKVFPATITSVRLGLLKSGKYGF